MKKLYLLFLLFTISVNAQEPFITTWYVSAEDLTIQSSVYGTDNNYTVDFGDGTVLTNQTQSIAHTYTSPGNYTVTLSGDFGHFQIAIEDASQLIFIEQWGDIQWTSMENAFAGCQPLTINAEDTPDLSQVTNMSRMFLDCTSLNQSINSWDVSNVTDMSYMFFRASNFVHTFNQPLDNWDVSNVTNMEGMFYGAHSFNQPLDNWDVSSVTDMSHMFFETQAFNQPLDNWNVSNVTDMSYMFYNNPVFNQPLNAWNTSSVTNLDSIFYLAGAFNQPLNNWNVSNVVSMNGTFNHSAFNQPIGNWDVSNVTSMGGMFTGTPFNHPIENWDVSNVTQMGDMFRGCEAFNQPLNNWEVSNVTNMGTMFANTSFNQPLNNWNISNVEYMFAMFKNNIVFDQYLNDWDVSSTMYLTEMFKGAASFNQSLSNWDVSNVTLMEEMFAEATAFNQDLSMWNFNQDIIFGTNGFINYTSSDIANYDALLLKFAQLGLENKTLNSAGLQYCDSGVRSYLINELGWTIAEDVLGEECLGNNITGNVIYDENTNGCDTEDPLIGSFLVKADDGEYGFSTISSNGEYDLRVIDGTYNVSLLNVPSYYTVTPPSSEIAFTGFGNEDELNFCLTTNEAINDLNITLIPVNEARPGFESHYKLIAENIGTQTITGATASFTFNETIQEFVTASQAPASEAVNQLTFDFGTILPLESKSIDITMQTFTPPTVNGDETINFVATVTPDTNDNTPADNIYNLDQVVVNSFDPNDKRILQGEEIFMEQTESYLDYVIRFQNTGTASAITVRIEDVLHENLDWTTFKPVTSSHDYRVEITDGNQVEFIFDNINLPHEEADEEGSNGYVAYKIKAVEDIAIGDVITGTASIFFDYNLPIVTNSADTKVVEPTSGINEHIATGLTVYPNPAKDILYLSVQDGLMIENIKIYSLQGSEIMNINDSVESVNIQDLSAGIYLLNIQTNQGISKHRLVKK